MQMPKIIIIKKHLYIMNLCLISMKKYFIFIWFLNKIGYAAKCELKKKKNVKIIQINFIFEFSM